MQMVEDGGLTELGTLLVRFPINPRFAKMLVLAHRADTLVDTHSQSLPLLAYTLTLVSALTEPNLFLRAGGNEPIADTKSDDDDDEGDDEDDESGRHNVFETEILTYLLCIWRCLLSHMSTYNM